MLTIKPDFRGSQDRRDRPRPFVLAHEPRLLRFEMNERAANRGTAVSPL